MESNMDTTTRNKRAVPVRNKSDLETEAPLMSQGTIQNGDIGTISDINEEDVECPADSPSGDQSQKRTTGLYSTFKKLVVSAKGAASKSVIKYIEKHLTGTKLIFVVGQSGTGKSTFLREISGMELHIGKSRNSGTKNYQVCPAMIEGEQYLFIDTPGFGAADIDDMDCFCDIVACLDVLGPFVTVAGLIFVTGGNQERLTAQELKTLQWMKCFCGPEFYKHITIMTNKWDKISEDDFEETWVSMLNMLEENPSISEILNPQSTFKHNSGHYEGGQVYHHGVVLDDGNPNVPLNRLTVRRHVKERSDMAVAMIQSRYRKSPGVKLQVVREMGNNAPWYNTEAAKVLKHNLKDIKLEFRDDILQVFVRSEGHAALQSVASHQKPDNPQNTNQQPCLEVAKMGKEYRRPASDEKPKEAEKQHQTWVDKALHWLGIAANVALTFFGARLGL
ncbi:P-loop containing nucleoside triphosphate hydrolase protein [Xylaria cf. heliscus]|nr:P-loop containing nucleoside triphosphate hydrolase protein [Xylaria cf. heliscus]